MIFSTGSKTFLVGEYSVLFGGGAIVLVTPPLFRLAVEKGKSAIVGIPEDSPAYKFYKLHDFENLAIRFYDPHGQAGGFGASSAQFALLYRLHLRLTRQQFEINSFLNEYRLLAHSEGISPSGADCVAQHFNHNIFFDSKNNNIELMKWNFPTLDFAIFKTNCKIMTHLHLKQLPSFDIGELHRCTLNVRKSFLDIDEEYLIKNVQTFFNLLKEKNLVIESTIKTIDELLKIDGVKAAKGCGALGADTIIIIFEKSKKDTIFSKINK